MSRSFVEPDLGLSQHYLRNSLSPKTWQGYCAAWSSWNSFREMYVNTEYSYPNLALSFINQLFSQGSSFSHVSRVIAGISFFQKWFNEPHMSGLFQVKQVLKGFRKGSFTQDSRRPITFEVLQSLVKACEQVCKSALEVQLFKTAFVLCFFGAFRISELVARNRQVPSALLLEDVSILDNVLVCNIRKSKTDQLGKGSLVRLSRFESKCCPVLLCELWLSVRPSCGSAFLCHADGSPLTIFQFSSVLKKCFDSIGLSGYRFTTHSFRIGAATEADSLGFDESSIRRIGRWGSGRFNLYVRPNLVLH